MTPAVATTARTAMTATATSALAPVTTFMTPFAAFVTTSMTTSMTTAVTTSSTTAAKVWSRRESADPEYRRREERAVQSVKRRNLLIVRLGGILRSVTFLPLRHLVAVVIALVAFVNAHANVGIVVPVNRAGLCRVLANLVRREVFHQPALVVSFNFDRRESRV